MFFTNAWNIAAWIFPFVWEAVVWMFYKLLMFMTWIGDISTEIVQETFAFSLQMALLPLKTIALLEIIAQMIYWVVLPPILPYLIPFFTSLVFSITCIIINYFVLSSIGAIEGSSTELTILNCPFYDVFCIYETIDTSYDALPQETRTIIAIIFTAVVDIMIIIILVTFYITLNFTWAEKSTPHLNLVTNILK